MGVVKTEKYIENGINRVREFYENGTIIERIDENEIQPLPEPLSPTEQVILQTAINTEYMMSLMEVKS